MRRRAGEYCHQTAGADTEAERAIDVARRDLDRDADAALARSRGRWHEGAGTGATLVGRQC